MQASVGLLCSFVPATRCIRFVAIMPISCWSISPDGQEYYCSTISTAIVPRYCYDDLLPHHRGYDITPDQGMEAVPRHVWCCLSSWWVHTIRCTALIRTIVESRVKEGRWLMTTTVLAYKVMIKNKPVFRLAGCFSFPWLWYRKPMSPGAKWRIMGRYHQNHSYSGIRQSVTHPSFYRGRTSACWWDQRWSKPYDCSIGLPLSDPHTLYAIVCAYNAGVVGTWALIGVC